MTQELVQVQQAAGARFDSLERPITFGNDAQAVAAAQQGVALYEASHWGRIEVRGGDRLRFLHNQTTNDFYRLKPGEGCDTVFVTSTARTIDLSTAYVLEDAVLLILSPGRQTFMLQFLDRYIFFADNVELIDRTGDLGMVQLIGPESHSLLRGLGIKIPEAGTEGHHQLAQWEDVTLRVAVGTGLALPGYTLLLEHHQVAALWQQLWEAGAIPLGDRPWEQLRIRQGRPMPPSELTEDYNPLEAGLWHLISFSKGCYIGQETIARLDTYKGVKQQLWGIRLQAIAQPKTPITIEGEKVGVLTSVTPRIADSLTTPDENIWGLAYIRTKAGGSGLIVDVGETTGELIAVPFLTYERGLE